MKVATVLNSDVSLVFSCWKYLHEPQKTKFRWFKKYKEVFDNGIKYKIRSDDLETNLSVRNTTKRDQGLHRIVKIPLGNMFIYIR